MATLMIDQEHKKESSEMVTMTTMIEASKRSMVTLLIDPTTPR
jgi:hypothetical protein